MDSQTCKICNAGFRGSAMIGEKCVMCAAKYPTAESGTELREKNSNIKAETLTDVSVRRMIYDVLAEAGFNRFKCEKCSSLYYRTSPAQKKCTVCRDKESK